MVYQNPSTIRANETADQLHASAIQTRGQALAIARKCGCLTCASYVDAVSKSGYASQSPSAAQRPQSQFPVASGNTRPKGPNASLYYGSGPGNSHVGGGSGDGSGRSSMQPDIIRRSQVRPDPQELSQVGWQDWARAFSGDRTANRRGF